MARPGILLHSGRYYSYDDPNGNYYTIEDVARGISNTCRYGGQVEKFYPVAQHAWLVSYAVKDKRYELEALCHDNVEAFMCDIPTPLKRMLPEYKAMEREHEQAMCNMFGLQYPFHPSVHAADVEVLCAEIRDLKPKDQYWDNITAGIEPYHEHITPWTPEKAYRMFLARYYELVGRRVIH